MPHPKAEGVAEVRPAVPCAVPPSSLFFLGDGLCLSIQPAQGTVSKFKIQNEVPPPSQDLHATVRNNVNQLLGLDNDPFSDLTQDLPLLVGWEGPRLTPCSSLERVPSGGEGKRALFWCVSRVLSR